MKSLRVLLALAVLGGMATLAYVGQRGEPAGAQMVVAAQNFLNTLSADQKKMAVYDFDSKERTNWHFIPLQDNKTRRPTRKGLPLQDMTPEQKKAAINLLAASTSNLGKEQAVTIMGLEAILRVQETKGDKPGAMVRDPEWYFFTVFGTPSKTGKWGWRVEGHHLSLNFTMDGTEVVSATPAFHGSNPATIIAGPKKGFRPLGDAEELAWNLFKALDADQKKIAYHDKQFPDVKPTLTPKVGDPVGLAAGKMTADQKGILLKLLHAYTDRMAPDVGAAEITRVKEAGIDNVYFAFNGGLEKGQKHTYRVQGPTFVIEFINEQNDSAGNQANHIHSVWRRMKGDFGLN
jgi:Protein of unknown function (DUF3500)